MEKQIQYDFSVYVMIIFCTMFPQTGKKLTSTKDHSKQINDLQLSKDMTMLISASKDTTAMVCSYMQSPVMLRGVTIQEKRIAIFFFAVLRYIAI